MAVINLVTGILGAGKTTFIKKLASYFENSGESVAVIENEYGASGVDADFLAGESLHVSELSGGCICCTQKVNFHDLIIELSEKYDRIIVEPSGVYNMDEFFDIVQSPDVMKKASVGGAVMILDFTPPSQMTDPVRRVMLSQLAGSGMVILSKTEGRSQREIEELLSDVDAFTLSESGFSRSLKTTALCTSWDLLTNDDFARISCCGVASAAHKRYFEDHSKLFSSTVIYKCGSAHKDELSSRLRCVMSGSFGIVFRVKGYVRCKNGECFSVNCTKDDFEILPVADHGTYLNIIGENFDRRAIKAML